MSHEGAGISSTASVPQPPRADDHAASQDPAWKYATLPDVTKKNALKCNFCDKICTNGVTRIKFHLAGLKGFNTTGCLKVPRDVRQEMLAFLLKSNGAKDKKVEALQTVRGKVNLDHSEGEESDEDDGNEVVVLKPKPRKSSLKARNNFEGGSIQNFFSSSTIEESVSKNSLSNKVQTQLSTQEREKKRNRACEYICQFFYEASIPHNTVTLPSFACMLEAVGRFGKDLKGPSAYEMSGPFLQKRKKRVMDSFKAHKETWEHTGCTIMTDAWTDRKNRGVMNLVVHSALFLDSVDCSAVKKDGKYIFELVDGCIETIGAEKVIQVMTDNASVNMAAASLSKAKRPSIFWNGCAAHTIDLMLEDIGSLKLVEKTITQARLVTVFLYAHIRVWALMRSILKQDLVRSGVTRFATAYLNLKSLQDNKNGLQKLFRADELIELGCLKKDSKGDQAHKVVKSEAFWKRVDIAVNFFEPMANVLRRMDSDVPAMGFFYGCMLDAKNEILSRFDNDESRCKSVLEIIDKRWDNKLKKPLHLAGYFLNPYYYYPNKVQIEKDGKFRAAVITCITTLIADDEEQDKMIEELKQYRGGKDSFGTDIATRQRRNKNYDPATWWLNHGTSSPNLKNLAVKILSLTCSSSGCERNFSAFEQVHAKKRSRLLSERLRDLVFVKVNSRMIDKKQNKRMYPIENILDDVLEDEENEFITGIVPEANVEVQREQPDTVTEEPEASISQAQRRRQAHIRKKRKKSVHSLLNCLPEEATYSDSSSSSSSETEGTQPQVNLILSDASADDSD